MKFIEFEKKVSISDFLTILAFIGSCWIAIKTSRADNDSLKVLIEANQKNTTNLIQENHHEAEMEIKAMYATNQEQIKELWKLHDGDRDVELKSTVLTLQTELGTQYLVISANLDVVNSDLSAIDEGKLNVLPLYVLPDSAWETARLRNTIFIDTTADFIKMTNLYIAVEQINTSIRYRENYIESNQNQPHYIEIVKNIDTNLKKYLEHGITLNAQAQAFMRKKYPLELKGRPFKVEEGVVKE